MDEKLASWVEPKGPVQCQTCCWWDRPQGRFTGDALAEGFCRGLPPLPVINPHEEDQWGNPGLVFHARQPETFFDDVCSLWEPVHGFIDIQQLFDEWPDEQRGVPLSSRRAP